jgi:hypothetical protein
VSKLLFVPPDVSRDAIATGPELGMQTTGGTFALSEGGSLRCNASDFLTSQWDPSSRQVLRWSRLSCHGASSVRFRSSKLASATANWISPR